MELTETQQRYAALFCRDIYEHLRKRDRRRPSTMQTVVACYAAAAALVDAEVGHHSRYLGAPSSTIQSSWRLALQEVAGPAVKFYKRLTDTALSVVEFFDQAGDSATARDADSVAVDRRLLSLAAQLWRAEQFSERAIARASGLHKSSVNDRLTSRAVRTLRGLHQIAPSIWSAKCRPVEGPIDGAGKVWSSDTALPLAA